MLIKKSVAIMALSLLTRARPIHRPADFNRPIIAFLKIINVCLKDADYNRFFSFLFFFRNVIALSILQIALLLALLTNNFSWSKKEEIELYRTT